jgi:Protein of unknown function (DUF1579)
MRRLSIATLALLACLAVARSAAVSDEPPMSEAEQQKLKAEMMKKMMEVGRLGQHHKDLAYYLGTWDGEVVFPGMSETPSKAVGEGAWVLPGRWMGFRVKGTIMGAPSEVYTLFGYDNVKKAHVATTVNSMDTSMIHTQGTVVDPSGKIVSQYGTLDEYLTGEHDKMVKYVWRFVSPTQLVLEVHDLPIGEANTKVVEITFRK